MFNFICFIHLFHVFITTLFLSNDVTPKHVAITDGALAIDRKKELRVFVAAGLAKVRSKTDEMINAWTPKNNKMNRAQIMQSLSCYKVTKM